MRVLIFHGYLLRGTGSNVYNAALGEAFARNGHEVHLLSQDRVPFEQAWVDAAGDWDSGALNLEVRRDPTRATVYRPDIGGVLPVYVADRYDGVEARPYPDLSDAEVADYVERNVAAVAEVVARARPDIALANHLVMGPLILARALAGTGVPYAVKIHGSALEYTVKPYPRFMPAAREGLARASGVLVGSRHTGESLWAAMGDPGLEARTRLGPPGVDVARFAPRTPADAAAGWERLRAALAATAPAFAGVHVDKSSFARSAEEAAAALGELVPGRDRIVLFIGKLIASKGVELLLAAWPLVLARAPDARLLIVGFGAFRERLEAFAAALSTGDLEAARALRGEMGASSRSSPRSSTRWARRRRRVPRRRRRDGRPVTWAGRLEHEELDRRHPGRRGAGDAQHVPRGVRHGGRGGGGRWGAARGRRPLRHGRGGERPRRGRSTRGAALAHVHGRPGLRAPARGRARLLARGVAGAPRAYPRRDRRRGARALQLGRRRPHHHRGGRGPPRRVAEPLAGARRPDVLGSAGERQRRIEGERGWWWRVRGTKPSYVMGLVPRTRRQRSALPLNTPLTFLQT